MATQNDINIKIQVDTTQANQSTDNYKKRLKELTEEMTALQVETDGLSKASEEQRKRFAQLSNEAGKIKDAMSDAQQQVKNLSDDYKGMTATLQGVQGAIGGITAVSGALNLLGVDSDEAAQSIKQITSLMGVLQGIQTVQKTLNKDSALMTVLRTAKEKLLTNSLREQTTAQLALNAAKLGAVGAIAAVVTALGVLVYKYASAKSEVAKFNEELNEQAAESIAPLIIKINELSASYTALGDDLEAKEQFINDNKKAFDDLGVSVTSVNDAENLLVENSDKFIKAQTLRAKATAARAKMEELAKQSLENELEFERVFVDKQTTIWEDLANLNPYVNDDVLKSAYKREQKRISDQQTKLQELTKSYTDEANAILNEIGVTEKSTETTEKKTTAQDVLNASLDRTATLIKLNYSQAIANATSETEKYILQKQQENELLSNEIKQRENLSKRLSENSTEWAKNELKLIELRQARENLYNIEVVSDEEENELLDIAIKQIDVNKQRADSIANDLVPATELFSDALKQADEEENEYLENLKARQTEELEIRSAKWQAAEKMVSTYSDLVNTAMEAELEAVGDNEEEQKAIRKKYAKAQFISQIASIGISTAKAIMETWSAYGEIPFVGTALAAAQSALITGLGIAQTIKAKQQMDTAMKAEKGGILQGASHANGGIKTNVGVELEGGEAVINKRSTAAFAPLLSQINSFNGYGAPLINNAQYTPANGAGMSTDTIQKIVAETVAGVASIPVVVTEHSISEAQRTVNITKERSFL